jgi:uncharacterized membrane protein
MTQDIWAEFSLVNAIFLICSIAILIGVIIYFIGSLYKRSGPKLKAVGLIIMIIPAVVIAIYGGVDVPSDAIFQFANAMFILFIAVGFVIGFINMIAGVWKKDRMEVLEGVMLVLIVQAIVLLLLVIGPVLAPILLV